MESTRFGKDLKELDTATMFFLPPSLLLSTEYIRKRTLGRRHGFVFMLFVQSSSAIYVRLDPMRERLQNF